MITAAIAEYIAEGALLAFGVLMTCKWLAHERHWTEDRTDEKGSQ